MTTLITEQPLMTLLQELFALCLVSGTHAHKLVIFDTKQTLLDSFIYVVLMPLLDTKIHFSRLSFIFLHALDVTVISFCFFVLLNMSK